MYPNSANLIVELLSAWPRSKICFLKSVSMWAAPCFKPDLDKSYRRKEDDRGPLLGGGHNSQECIHTDND